MIWLISFLAVVLAVFGLTVLRGAPYVPSKRRELTTAFEELYTLKKTDVLVDIGSGDGVVLRAAARRGAQAVGFEINPFLVLVSQWLSRKQQNVSVKLADFWLTPFPDDTTIVYTFGESRDITKMYKKVAREATRLHRPLWFISYGFRVPDVKPERTKGVHHLYQVAPLQED